MNAERCISGKKNRITQSTLFNKKNSTRYTEGIISCFRILCLLLPTVSIRIQDRYMLFDRWNCEFVSKVYKNKILLQFGHNTVLSNTLITFFWLNCLKKMLMIQHWYQWRYHCRRRSGSQSARFLPFLILTNVGVDGGDGLSSFTACYSNDISDVIIFVFSKLHNLLVLSTLTYSHHLWCRWWWFYYYSRIRPVSLSLLI